MRLQKKMFFLPRKFSVVCNKIFLQFNLLSIPKDMEIPHMFLYIPLPDSSTAIKVTIKEIVSKWREKNITKGKLPAYSAARIRLEFSPHAEEAVIEVTSFCPKWRLPPKMNYGIYVQLSTIDSTYLQKDSPYLIVDTI